MIRLVTEQTAAPMFLVLCDHPHCGVYAKQKVCAELGQENAEMLLLQTLAQSKWSVGILGVLCPYHCGATTKSMIEVAKTIPGVLN
jgi:hypothetical protein